jgi:hypothetical protein
MSAALRTVSAVALVCVLCLALSGCGGPGVTKANYDAIKPGMTKADVEKLLGGPGHDPAGDAAKATSKAVEDLTKKTGDAVGAPGLGDLGKMAGDALKSVSGIAKAVQWGDDNKWVVVVFVDDKVQSKDSKGL